MNALQIPVLEAEFVMTNLADSNVNVLQVFMEQDVQVKLMNAQGTNN
jgi:hypothetical protein